MRGIEAHRENLGTSEEPVDRPQESVAPIRNQLSHLFKGAAIYIGGDLVTKLLAFVLIPIYTRYLVPADYGVIEVVKSFANGLMIVCALGLNGAMTRYYFDFDDSKRRARYFGATMLALIGNALVVVLLLDRLGGGLFARLFPGIPFDPFFRLAIWTIFLITISSVVLVLYRVREEPWKYVAFQISQSVVGFVLVIYFVVVQQNGALGKLQGEFLAAIALVAVAAYMMRSHVRLSWSWFDVKKSLAFGIPLVPHLLFWWVIDLSDRIFLQHYGTLQEVGVYSLGYNLAGIMVVLIVGVNNAWAPYFFSVSDRPGSRGILARLLTYCLCAFLLVGLVLALFSRELVGMISTPEYYAASRVMPTIVVAFVFMGLATLLVNLIFYGRTSYYMPAITGSAAIVNVALNVVLIPRFGMLGAAYATAVSMAVYAGAVLVVSQRVYRIDYERRKIAAVVVAFTILLAIGGQVQLDDALVAVAVKACITAAFAVFLWRSGIVRLEDLSVFRRQSTVGV